jgi:bacillithiol biosynthesis deacetylase BshB1
MKLDALFFGTHPDDIEITCGGTVIKLVKAKKKVGIVDLTLGELSTRGNVKSRQQEARASDKILGVKFRENLKLKDGSIENSYENRLKIIKIIRKYTPHLVFLPYQKDRHPDHINASVMIREAAFFSGLAKIKTKKYGAAQSASGGPYRPKKLIYYMHAYQFEPSFIIDITGEFNSKMEALKCYKSQFHDPSNKKEPETFISDKKFWEFIEARARFYGFQIGVRYGEPFFTEEKLNLSTEAFFNI